MNIFVDRNEGSGGTYLPWWSHLSPMCCKVFAAVDMWYVSLTASFKFFNYKLSTNYRYLDQDQSCLIFVSYLEVHQLGT